MSVERARGLLVDLLYKEHLGTRSGDMIAEALRELQDPPNRLDTNADALHDCEKALTDLVSYWRKDLSKTRDENLVLDMADDVEDIAKNLRELQPGPRIIDWQRVVDQQLPVMVWGSSDPENAYLAFLRGYDGHENKYPFRVGKLWKECASLETGQWVFNGTGENPWPGGVLVEVWFNSRPKQLSGFWRADECLWGFSGGLSDRIIASRAVGLEDGWSYGGGE